MRKSCWLVALVLATGCGKEKEVLTTDFYLTPESFPAEWLKEPYNATGEETINASYPSRAEILKLIRPYEASVIREHVHRICLVRNFAFNGQFVQAATHENAIFLTPASGGGRREYPGQAFHEELGRIFLREYPEKLDRKAWEAANPAGFSYAADTSSLWLISEENATKDRMRPRDEESFKKGFVSKRGMGSFQDDVITTAGALMSGYFHPNDYYQHPILEKKAKLILAFYSKIHPGLQERWKSMNRGPIEQLFNHEASIPEEYRKKNRG